ncbi:hypothetical protein [Agromyces allii]|uniref:STAS/SEC14 domain-containing protein n=1 Tax=Agromyces allii TaxID=393607 RepID=A0ABP5CUH6_9MICO|nr:hypothetical protein [Agromyces allii]
MPQPRAGAERATTIVFLDYSRTVVMARVVRRTLRRRIRRTELWNGNREAPLATMLTDRDHIIRWAWRTHPTWRGQVADAASRHPSLDVVRLANPREAERWLAAGQPAVGASTAPPKRRLRDA